MKKKIEDNPYLRMDKDNVDNQIELMIEGIFFTRLRILKVIKDKLLHQITEGQLDDHDNQSNLLKVKRLQEYINKMEIDFINECFLIYPDNKEDE